eukprot:COSAG01_NODE_22828_length_839_cov_2.275676_1_plen_177_part_01
MKQFIKNNIFPYHIKSMADILPLVVMPDPVPNVTIDTLSDEDGASDDEPMPISGVKPPIEDRVFKDRVVDPPKLDVDIDASPQAPPELTKGGKPKRKASEKQLAALKRNREKLKAKRDAAKQLREEAKLEAEQIIRERQKQTAKNELLPRHRRELELSESKPTIPPVDVQAAISSAL